MIQDLHSHTYYSYCGKDSPEAVIQNAIKNGVELVGISDHYYGIVMNRSGFNYRSDEEKITMHTNALKRYYEHIKLLAEKYKDYIKVWCGIEIATLNLGYTLQMKKRRFRMFLILHCAADVRKSELHTLICPHILPQKRVI